MAAVCVACQSSNTKTYLPNPRDIEYFVERSQVAEIRRCGDCGSLFQNPWPSEGEISKFYPPDYQNYSGRRRSLLAGLLRWQNASVAQRFVAEHGRDAAVLDFGCGDGSFLLSLYEQGVRDLVGYEPHEREASYTPGEIRFYSDVDSLVASGQRFDVIRMNHVIEHLHAPDSTVTALAALLSEGGRILVQTPNPDTLSARIFGRWWGALHFPYHTVIFTPRGIAAMSTRCGMAVRKISGALMPTGWSMSVENALKETLGIRKRGRQWFYAPLVLAALPIAFVETLFGGHKAAIIDYELVRRG
jgi:SAM-dependent methyltransferase